jgi:hypothetical protein
VRLRIETTYVKYMYRDFFDSFRQVRKITCLEMEVFTLALELISSTFLITMSLLRNSDRIDRQRV